MTAPSARFSRLVLTVPRRIAEPYGAALVEAGAGAVQECDTPDPNLTEIWLTLPDGEATDLWRSLAESMFRAFAEALSLPTEGFAVRSERCEFDYHEEWLKHLTAQRLTDSLWFVPTTAPTELAPDVKGLLFEPRPAFGDGSHPTTKLAAQGTESFCRRHAGCRVLDVGTGNGVLSFVAAVSGAASTLGIDIDENAICAAQNNAHLNQLEGCCAFVASPLESLLPRSNSPQAALDQNAFERDGLKQFDLVVANLEPRAQVGLVQSMAPLVQPGGRLILTGFLLDQAPTIAEPLRHLGFAEVSSTELEGYVMLVLDRLGERTETRTSP